jgi:predicted ester cyclase
MSGISAKTLAQEWAELWNGRLELADRIISSGFVSHAAPLTGGPVADSVGREALKQWIGGIHMILQDARFTIEVGPIADGDMLVVRWVVTGVNTGGMPGGDSATAGRTVSFAGTDILRLDGDLIAEYWVNADIVWFFQQLGITAIPAL